MKNLFVLLGFLNLILNLSACATPGLSDVKKGVSQDNVNQTKQQKLNYSTVHAALR